MVPRQHLRYEERQSRLPNLERSPDDIRRLPERSAILMGSASSRPTASIARRSIREHQSRRRSVNRTPEKWRWCSSIATGASRIRADGLRVLDVARTHRHEPRPDFAILGTGRSRTLRPALRVEMRVSPFLKERRLLEDLEGTPAKHGGRVGVLALDRPACELETRRRRLHCTDRPDVLKAAVRRIPEAIAEDPAALAVAQRALIPPLPCDEGEADAVAAGSS